METGSRDQGFENTFGSDVRCPQAFRGNTRDPGRRKRREQLGGLPAPKAFQLDVDDTEYDGGAAALGIPLEHQTAVDGVAREHSRRLSGAAERLRERRQGLRDRRVKCKGDDRRVVYPRPRHRSSDARGGLGIGKIDQSVRAADARVRAPHSTSAVRIGNGVDGFVLCVGEGSVYSEGEEHHGLCIVRHRPGAILRVRRALVVSTGKNSAWISLDDEPAPRVAALRRMTGKRFMPVPGDIVEVRLLEDGHAVVDRIEPRGFALERRSADGRAKTMAANVDLLVTVTSLANPPPRLITLDQLLAFSELESIAAAAIRS